MSSEPDGEGIVRPLRQRLLRALPATALVGATLGVTAVGPGVFSAFAGGLHHRSESAIVVTPSIVPTSSTSPASSSAAAGGPTVAATTPPSATAATTTTTPAATPTTLPPSTPEPTAVAPTVVAPAEVTTIQIVPAVRDVVVEIGGSRYSSAGDGTISVPAVARHGEVRFVGVQETPSLRQVTFGSWADGDTSTTRSLDTLSGPVVQLGLTLSYRVTVVAAGVDSVDFTSAGGLLTTPVGVAEWVPAARAVVGAAGLTTQTLDYTAQSVTLAGDRTPIAPVIFSVTPEALWTVPTT